MYYCCTTLPLPPWNPELPPASRTGDRLQHDRSARCRAAAARAIGVAAAGLLSEFSTDFALDALLGALSLGDIGKYFPPTDPKWKGADSLVLLEQVVALVKQRGWSVVNVDAVVIAERPKLKPHIEAMRSNIAARIGLDPEAVGVKATTNEKLGPEGREEGISCQAVALLGLP